MKKFKIICFVLISIISISIVNLCTYANTLSDYYVASIGIFADTSDTSASSLNWNGHAFLVVENTNDHAITVGYMRVPVGGVVTIGTWSNSNHRGVLYNLEAKMANEDGAFTDSVNVFEGINRTQLSALNNYIKNHDTWWPIENCATFACGAWNSIIETQLSAEVPNTPTFLRESIISVYGNYNTGYAYPNNSNVGYYDSGNFVSI